MSSTPSGVYPLSTRQGLAIPLDVAKPLSGTFSRNINPGDSLIFDVTAPISTPIIISVYSDQLAELFVEDEDAEMVCNFFMVPDTLYDLAIVLPTPNGTINIENLGEANATMVINQVQRWTQLDNQNYTVS